jgi:hypothetical protein
VWIENVGKYPVPVSLTVKYTDGTEKVVTRKMDIWKAGAGAISIEVPAGKISELILNGPQIPESTSLNNRKRPD